MSGYTDLNHWFPNQSRIEIVGLSGSPSARNAKAIKRRPLPISAATSFSELRLPNRARGHPANNEPLLRPASFEVPKPKSFNNNLDSQHVADGNESCNLCARCEQTVDPVEAARLEARHLSTKEAQEANVVTWDGPQDLANPKNWPRRKKWTALVTSALVTFCTSFAASISAPTIYAAGRAFDRSPEVMLLSLSLYVVGMAIGPLVW